MSYIWLSRYLQDSVAAIASGYHRADGTPFLGETRGATTGTPNYHNYYRQVLGKGTWNRVRSVYFEGFNVPSTDYEFYDGTTGANTMFDRDSDHPGNVLINVKAPNNLGTPITPTSSLELPVIFVETEVFPDFDSVGNQIDENGNIVSAINDPLNTDFFFYNVNPANVLIGWLLKYASTYNRHSFNWAKWVLWRNYLGGLETVDYRVIPNEKGEGLTANFYSDTTFTTLVPDAKRKEPYLNFVADDDVNGSPALGIDPQSFSARYEGFIKPKFTEEFTLLVARSDTAKIWIDDVLIIDEGEFTNTVNLTADQFHKIRVDWVNASGDAELVLSWSSTNTPLQVVKKEHFYQKVEQHPRYSAHMAISSPATPDFLITQILQISNSTIQKTDGKYVFECFEQKVAAVTLTESDIIRENETGLIAKWEQTSQDAQTNQNYDVFELIAGDIDDRYLQPFAEAVSYYRDPANVPENPLVNQISLQVQNVFTVNMTRWQAFKILKILMARTVTKDLKFSEIVTKLDKTYPLQGADIFNLDFPAAGIEGGTFLITETTDDPPEEAEHRRLVIQRWFDEAEFQGQMELDT